MRTLIAFCAVSLAAATASADFKTAVPRGNVQRVVVAVPAGEIKVRNGPADRISIDGYAERHDEIVEDTKLEIVVRDKEAIVRRTSALHFTSYTVTIEVPPGTAIDLATKYGDVRLDGSFGDVDADLNAGEIRLRTPRTQVRELNASAMVGEVHTNLGDRTISREGLFPGRTHWTNEGGRSRINLHTTAGEVHVTLTQP